MSKFHSSVTQTSKFCPQLLDYVLKVGHYQLLKKKIAYELNTACKFEAKHMEAALQTLNTYVQIYRKYFLFILIFLSLIFL